jgi:CBS domain-containing protein
MELTVQQLMTPYPIVVDVATPVAQCARLMDDRDIGALGVMEEGRLVDPKQITAGEIATKEVVAVAPSASIAEAERNMREHAVRRLFVVAEDGRPAGIITVDDLIAIRDPNSIVAKQIREWDMVRSDQGYSGD